MFDKAQYAKEVRRLVKQAEALRPAAKALGLEQSLSRAVTAIVDHKIDVQAS